MAGEVMSSGSAEHRRRRVCRAGSSARCIFISAEPQRQGTSTGITTGRPQAGLESSKERSYHCTKVSAYPGKGTLHHHYLTARRGSAPPPSSSSFFRPSKQARLTSSSIKQTPKGPPSHGAAPPATVFVVPDWAAD